MHMYEILNLTVIIHRLFTLIFVFRLFLGVSLAINIISWTINPCQDLNALGGDGAQSVNTGGDCVMICEQLQCKGRCERVADGTPNHNDLAQSPPGLPKRLSAKRCK